MSESAYREPWMSDDQWECANLLADVLHGFHHMPGTIKQHGRGIKIAAASYRLATFDYNALTALVVLAHDRMIRVEITGSGPGRVGIICHKRHKREGRMNERHPTIEDAVVTVRKAHPQPLWCMHIQGPDDVYPAPSKEVAEIGAQVFNRLFGEKSEGSGILMKAVAAPWPHSPESHAEEAAKFVEQCILPRGEQGGAS